MAMASSAEGLVPITRAFLARYYDTCPLPPLSEDVSRLTAQLRELSDGLARESPLTSGDFPAFFVAMLSFSCFRRDFEFDM